MDGSGSGDKDQGSKESQPTAEGSQSSIQPARRNTKNVSLSDRLEMAQSALADLRKAGITVEIARLDGAIAIVLTGNIDYAINGNQVMLVPKFAINGNGGNHAGPNEMPS